MKAQLSPFNLGLLNPSAADIKNMRQIKVLDITEGGSKNFHPDGLFSIDIFGKVGEEKRNRLFAYIDLHMSVFHPAIYKALEELKSLYADILSGKGYAVFDETIKDFVASSPVEGNTGFAFFVKHFKNIKFEERPSAKREFNIRLVAKYLDTCLIDKLVVIPAGVRDYVIDETGKPSEDEINGLYRKMLSVSNLIENVNESLNSSYLDSARYNLQLGFIAIYDYITNMLEGKSRLVLGKWAQRAVFNSTRNVITSYIPTQTELFGKSTVGANQTVVGLYQFSNSIMPLAIKQLRDTYLSSIFTGPNTPAMLVNKKTLKQEMVSVDPSYYDDYMSNEGLEKIMLRFSEEVMRHDYVEIGDYYLGLMYKGPDKTYRFMSDISELPEGRLPEHVTPITMAELLYLSIYKVSQDVPCTVTRYPVTGYGSIYPGYAYLKTTVRADARVELDRDWVPTEHEAVEFPIYGEQFFNSMGPNISHLMRLNAD